MAHPQDETISELLRLTKEFDTLGKATEHTQFDTVTSPTSLREFNPSITGYLRRWGWGDGRVKFEEFVSNLLARTLTVVRVVAENKNPSSCASVEDLVRHRMSTLARSMCKARDGLRTQEARYGTTLAVASALAGAHQEEIPFLVRQICVWLESKGVGPCTEVLDMLKTGASHAASPLVAGTTTPLKQSEVSANGQGLAPGFVPTPTQGFVLGPVHPRNAPLSTPAMPASRMGM
jgi:hypothetical protein